MTEDKLYMTSEELINSDIKDPSWIIENVIAENGATLFNGSPKSSKSMLALHLAICVASGNPFLGLFPVKQGRVLYIDEENGHREIKDRCLRLMKGMNIKIANIDFMIHNNIKLDGKLSIKWKKEILRYLEERQPILVICDSMVRFMEGDENSSKDVRQVYDFIKSLKKDRGWLLLHHTAKGREDPRGSGDWSAQVDDEFYIHKTKKQHNFILEPKLSRRASDIHQVRYNIAGEQKEPLKFNVLDNLQREVDSASSKCAQEILKWKEKEGVIDEFKTKTLHDEMIKKFKNNAIHSAITELIDQNKLERTRFSYYRFK